MYVKVLFTKYKKLIIMYALSHCWCHIWEFVFCYELYYVFGLYILLQLIFIL